MNSAKTTIKNGLNIYANWIKKIKKRNQPPTKMSRRHVPKKLRNAEIAAERILMALNKQLPNQDNDIE